MRNKIFLYRLKFILHKMTYFVMIFVLFFLSLIPFEVRGTNGTTSTNSINTKNDVLYKIEYLNSSIDNTEKDAKNGDENIYNTVNNNSKYKEDTYYIDDIPLQKDLQEYIYLNCLEYDIDYYLVLSIIKKESNFNASAVSKTNDYGLMQINKINHKWLKNELGITNFLDPYQNVNAGMHILKNLYKKYDDTNKIIMAYHLGEQGAKNKWKKGIYTDTYVTDVNKIYKNITK